MYDNPVYSYYMRVLGSPEDMKKVYELLEKKKNIIGTYLSPDKPVAPKEPPYSTYSFPTEAKEFREWDELEMEETLHEISLQVPNAVLEIEGNNEDNPSRCFLKRLHGDLYQETRQQIIMPLMSENGEVPFSQRHAARENPPPVKMSILCQEHEDEGGIREFTILGVSADKEQLRKLMAAKIEKDEFGFIAEKGIADDDPDHFSTQYNEGKVEYYILEKDVLTPELIQEMLQTEAYTDTYHSPDNLRDVLISSLQNAAEFHVYGEVDTEKAADKLLADKQLQGMVKTSWWGSENHLTDKSFQIAAAYCFQFINDRVEENPNYFEQMGIIPEFHCPENLREILIGSIYDVARDHHLPVLDAGKLADQYMRHSEFRSLFHVANGDTSPLAEGTDRFQNAAWSCYDFVESKMLPKHEVKPALDVVIGAAKKKLHTLPSTDQETRQQDKKSSKER